MINELLRIVNEAEQVIEHYQKYEVSLRDVSEDLADIDHLLTDRLSE